MLEREHKTYHFFENENCNMCLEQASSHRVLGVRLDKSQGRSPRRKTGVGVTVCKCSNCGLIYPQPLVVPLSISDHYNIDPDTYWNPSYFELSPDYFSRQINDAKRLLDNKAEIKALDIGAGLGKAMIAMDAAGFNSWGIEPSEAFRDKAIDQMGIDPGKLALGSIEEADFKSEKFDFITFGAVLEHLYDPAQSISQAMNWLKPGGVIQIEVPSSNYFLSKILNLYYKLRRTNYVTHLSPMHSPYHLYEFNLESFQEHGARTCYDVVYSYYDVGSMHNFPNAAKLLLGWYMDKTNSGMQLTVWLRKKK